ncbi:hypothetical protein A5746_10250 [Mycolicibacterium conceptionense]|uniref:hypothetical protein n=1 Tax=Mycolicibacterium conceptionense TaxID=451644 RepID=UPI0007EE0371|nr:hypothetical protein [Mycolicibacterium conceptionense]OBK04671.1 hypothetical protein A5639_20570 [Mycolicibacterium conceptionense]OMB90350.1 hypothetical protein A5741_12285 [Mycolicibacterium conceptionense]OMC02071.1 hypothetical protein A5746_10250 [Mycolicibacterium conceptionense]
MIDTRLIQARDDAKAGAAAADDGERATATECLDDARAAVWQLLNAETDLADRDRSTLRYDLKQFEEAIKLLQLGKLKSAVYVADRIIGSLTRLVDRWVS